MCIAIENSTWVLSSVALTLASSFASILWLSFCLSPYSLLTRPGALNLIPLLLRRCRCATATASCCNLRTLRRPSAVPQGVHRQTIPSVISMLSFDWKETTVWTVYPLPESRDRPVYSVGCWSLGKVACPSHKGQPLCDWAECTQNHNRATVRLEDRNRRTHSLPAHYDYEVTLSAITCTGHHHMRPLPRKVSLWSVICNLLTRPFSSVSATPPTKTSALLSERRLQTADLVVQLAPYTVSPPKATVRAKKTQKESTPWPFLIIQTQCALSIGRYLARDC